MAITFKALISTAPFDNETKQNILSREEGLSEDQKRELTELAWDLLRKEYELDLQERFDGEFDDMNAGKKQYNPQVFTDIQNELTDALMKRIHASDESEELQDVREDIQKELVQKTETLPPTPVDQSGTEESSERPMQEQQSSQPHTATQVEIEAKQQEENLTKQAVEKARQDLLQSAQPQNDQPMVTPIQPQQSQ